MRKRSPFFLWLLLVLAYFHAAASAGHLGHGHGHGLTSAVAASAHADDAPDGPDRSPGAAHTHCSVCALHAHNAWAPGMVPAAWAPPPPAGTPLRWARRADAVPPMASHGRFAARDPPQAG